MSDSEEHSDEDSDVEKNVGKERDAQEREVGEKIVPGHNQSEQGHYEPGQSEQQQSEQRQSEQQQSEAEESEAAGRPHSESEFDQDLTATKSSQPKSADPVRSIGPYRLLQKIGEGGMGTVYVAEQTDPVRRQVALKVIKLGILSKDILARFESERQALALMNHPNIARILDAGTTDDGEPFFVMELVKGVPIIKHCQDSNLGIRGRIELFQAVCDAIHHAHQKGIMHRDIKSSNVLVEMVDDQPTVKVIDFGLAKAVGQQLTDKTLFTEFGQVVGTLEYMSPEQASLDPHDVDTRTDIYSLGVLLYELLTGSTPLEKSRIRKSALDQILRLIREEEPELPSARLSKISSVAKSAALTPGSRPKSELQPAPSSSLLSHSNSKVLRGELDWVVMKTLEKDRSRRYDSVSALTGDLRNFLMGDPVQARPYSFAYRLRKSLVKHRNWYLTGTALVLALLLGMVGTSIGMYRAKNAEAVSRNQLRKIESQKSELDAQLVKIRESNDRANRHVAEIRHILEEFGQSAAAEPLAQNSKLNSFRESTFLAILNHFQQLSDEYPANDELKFELGKAHFGLAAFYRNVHAPQKSLKAYAAAIQILEQLLQADSQNDLVAIQLGMAHQNIAEVLLLSGKDDSVHLDQAGKIWSELAQENPKELRFRRNQIVLRSQIALRNYQAGEIDQAVEIEKQNERELTQLFESQPENADLALMLFTTSGQLANWEIDRENFEAAQTFAANAYRMTEKYAAIRNEENADQNQVNILNTWSIAIKGSGDYEAALEKREQALSVAKRLYADHPDSMNIRHSLGLVLSNLTRDYGFLKRFQEAKQSINESIEIRKQLSKDYPQNASFYAELAKSLYMSALLEHDLGDRKLAAERIRQSVKMLEKVATRLPHARQFAQWYAEAQSIQQKIEADKNAEESRQ